jgi:phospholipid/cholesterol/gamma-HCH transport system substrate-binding protein
VSAVTVRRVVVLVALAGVAIIAAALVSGGSDGYKLKAQFDQAGGLRAGFKVRIDGAPVGKIDKLELDSQDRVVATLLIDKSAAPVGRDVRATARAADLLGEKFVDLEPGNRQDPAPSGTVIPPSRTGLAIELDDVINAVDLPTRTALRAFIAEQGEAYVGRGRDINATLAALPWALDRSGALLGQFATDNRALARLVDESDRVVGAVARERAQLGRFVSAASGTLKTLGHRQAELGATVRKAPATLAAARRALASLEGAAVPLAPAARGLRKTAPQLTATLNELPGFTKAARPTLREARKVAPTLRTLGRRGAPVVRDLKPLAAELDTFVAELADELLEVTLRPAAEDAVGLVELHRCPGLGRRQQTVLLQLWLRRRPGVQLDVAVREARGAAPADVGGRSAMQRPDAVLANGEVDDRTAVAGLDLADLADLAAGHAQLHAGRELLGALEAGAQRVARAAADGRDDEHEDHHGDGAEGDRDGETRESHVSLPRGSRR